MGEFSRRHIGTRRAEPGEELVLTAFGSGKVRGFAPVGEPRVAVGLPPGTEIRFDAAISADGEAGAETSAIGHQLARIRQIIVDNPSVHHDAVELAGSQFILLTHLCEGQRATVVRLPPQDAPATPFRTDNRRLSLEDIRLLTEPADDSGHPLFI